MTRNEEMKGLLERVDFKLSGGFKGLLYLFVAVGVVGFIVGTMSGHPHFAWQALLVNTIFFASISFGGLLFSIMWTVTDAKWSRPMKRIAEGAFAFMPVAVILFFVLFFGADYFFEWVDHEKVIHSKAGWLDMGFFVKRNIVMMALLLIGAWIYLKNTLRPDIGLAKKLTGFGNAFADKFTKGFSSVEEEQEKSFHKGHYIAPIFAFLIALVITLIAFDWMSSIDQEWFSTMYGVQYLAASLIGGMCFINLTTGWARSKYGLEDYVTTVRFHDMGKFIFAFCLLWTYMCFSQVLVIWYGNIPEETPFLILRMQSHEWSWLFWLLTVMMFLVPFFGLLSRTVCNSVWGTRILATEILMGLWLEKYFLIVPSIQENMVAAGAAGHGAHGAAHGPLGLPGWQYNIYDFALTLGVGGAFLLCFFWFMQRVPALPISDRNFFKDPNAHH